MSNLKIAQQIPFKVLVKRIVKRIFTASKLDYVEQEIRKSSSNYKLNKVLDIRDLNGALEKEAISHYLNHEFNLLGSGWVTRNSKKELELGTRHFFFTQQIGKGISDNYQFIDWQLDVKSGFRFDIKSQFNNQKIDQSKNVDIKNCWELGRLQHFPQMALAAKQMANKETIILEFKNQSLDFIISNPVGMGVQWACTMDVGIRVCNWLVAIDLFRQIDESDLLDTKFILLFTDYIHRHVEFIMNHLEGKEGAAGNHYLFNLVGILFATNYLSEKEESLTWRKFAEEEIQQEFLKQFFADGGNFEGSTTYHCLSSEAIIYATALMLRNKKSLSDEYLNRLGNGFYFIKDVIKPNGEMPQFGDNDSGRLFQFYPNQNLLNYEALISGFSELYSGDKKSFVENSVVAQLIGSTQLKLPAKRLKNKFQLRKSNHQIQHPTTTEIKFEEEINISKIKLYTYENFGIYIFKSSEFYLAISTISNKQMHHSWGHVHNDKLSFDLQVHNSDLVKDPGTYTYSAFPNKREAFRSSKAHNGIIVKGVEQNKGIGLFYLEREVECKVLEIKDLSITLQAKYYGVNHTRKFTILSNQLIVTDYCNKPFDVNINKFQEYSPNYGVIES